MSLSGLSRHETARSGNWFGIMGILLAIGATVLSDGVESGYVWLFSALTAGGLLGGYIATRVEMTAMPQLVALLHSFVGLAAVLVGFNSFLEHGANTKTVAGIIHGVETYIGVFIGAITFTGSLVAWGKLQGVIKSKPLLLPGRHFINLMALITCTTLGGVFIAVDANINGITILMTMTAVAFFLGAHLVLAIGGADMPVVVSMLNSYSGWAAAATGFMLANNLLIITGALVGSSGAILSYIMCRAMNRSFASVILGGFGTELSPMREPQSESLVYTDVSAEEVAYELKNAKEVIVIPGYGMAVAQAQHPIRDMMKQLTKRGVRVRFAIHPVAGRLPGHMNVLLAEANVPYDVVLEMDEINEDFSTTDVVLVIGANDIVNPGALDDTTSPIYGMPVLECWRSKKVVVMKRSMGSGYSGVDNPLFYKENTEMLFGDAKESSDRILTALRK